MDMGNIGGSFARPQYTSQKPAKRTDAMKLAEALNAQAGQAAETPEEMRLREQQEREARKAAEEEERRKKLQQKQQEKQEQLAMLKQELENSNEQAEAIGDEFKVYARCLTIASRISRGDTVPLKDMKYLAENEPDLFKQAILLRMPNDHPKKHKSVLDDDEEQQTEQTSESGESAAPEVSQPTEQAPGIPEEIAAEE